MALTPEKREVLKMARAKVAEAVLFAHICHILEEIGRERPDLWLAAMDIKEYIVAALDGAYTLEAWQTNNGVDFESRNPIANRLAWIDWMLDEPGHELWPWQKKEA